MKANFIPKLYLLFGVLLASFFYVQNSLDRLTQADFRNKYFQKVEIKNQQIQIPKITNHEIMFIGSDSKAVVSVDGKISQPLVAKNVNLLFKLKDEKTKKEAEFPVKNILISGRNSDTGKGEKHL